jgi:hypothetical protein
LINSARRKGEEKGEKVYTAVHTGKRGIQVPKKIFAGRKKKV